MIAINASTGHLTCANVGDSFAFGFTPANRHPMHLSVSHRLEYRGRRLRDVTEEDAKAMEGWRTSRGYEAKWHDQYDLVVKGDVCWPAWGGDPSGSYYLRTCSTCDTTETFACDAREGRTPAADAVMHAISA